MLDAFRKLGKRTLRRWPRLYTSARRAYARLAYCLGKPHDADFAFFANLGDTPGLFADIGANTGQSARSLRIFNTSLEIISFEPNRLLEPELRATRELLGDRFEYRLHGLGTKREIITLYFPVAGETLLSPWATADRQALERNRPAIEREAGTRITVEMVPIEIRRFDDLGLHPVVVKIDVEGFELDVLRGMTETLAADEPILLIESSAHTPEVIELLRPLGYRLFAYDPRENVLTEAAPAACNNYFALTDASIERLAAIKNLTLVLNEPSESAAEPVAV